MDGQSTGSGSRPAGSVTELTVAGRHGVPADASAVVLNVAVVDTEDPGFVTVWPCGTPMPIASNLNAIAGQTIANAVTTKVGVDGSVCLYNSAGTHLVADLYGYHPA